MRVTFPGVGAAFDEDLPNTCLLLETEDHSALLDCGFAAPFAFWRCAERPLELDALWISHFHGDHFFGTPVLILRFWELGRTKPLAIIGQQGVEETITTAMDLAYPGFREKLEFDLVFHEIEPGDTITAAGFTWQAAQGEHGKRNLAVRVEADNRSVFYSGDGRPTPDTLALARDTDLVAHEAFLLDPDNPGHGTVPGAIDFTRQAGARRLWLVHVNPETRRELRNEIEALLRDAADIEAFLPEPGDAVVV